MYLVLEHSTGADDLLKDVFSDVRVHGAQRVVKEIDVCLLVDGAGQTDTLLLSTTEVDPLTHTHTHTQREREREMSL